MKPVVRHLRGFRWEGIPLQPYKPEGTHFRDVTRQVLFGADAGTGGELRYFELEGEGYTTLERHQHVHQVMILRGRGRCLVGSEIFEVGPFDLVCVPPMTWHQFRPASREPLGFLCLVTSDRDVPQRPGEAELEALRVSPEVAAFIRV